MKKIIAVLISLIIFFSVFSIPKNNPMDACVLLTDGDGHGSGFAIRPNLIVTAGHVVDIPNLSVIDNKGNTYKIITSWRSKTQDIGFVWIDGKLPVTVKFGSIPHLLDKTYLVGAPFSPIMINNITMGMVSHMDIDISYWDNLIVTDAYCAPGSSGGPLFDDNWKVIGMCVMGFTRDGGMACCEPVVDIEIELDKCLDERCW